ncbi:hypothetical protein [Flagellimonas sp. GZD32]|uniref:hypothetical protein n=1 Tax=Flagellimonas cixiensis TaxID=3228750 RepID=UPI0035C91EF5
MNTISKIITWKRNLIASILVLLTLMVLDFYGIHTNQFYFLKVDNYIFSTLAVVHLLYLYVVWFKIREDELPDPKMRNVEYVLYLILFVYGFKIYESLQILNSAQIYQDQIIPSTFKPMATLNLILFSILPIMTLYTFWLRKKMIGVYNFDNYNSKLNIWQ